MKFFDKRLVSFMQGTSLPVFNNFDVVVKKVLLKKQNNDDAPVQTLDDHKISPKVNCAQVS